MKKLIQSIALALPLSLLFTSCEFIGGVFKAGVNVGVFLVLAAIALIIYFVSKARSNR